MIDSDLQYLTGPDGSVRSVVVPADAWQRVLSELETFHIVRSPSMNRRIREAMARANGISFDESIRQIEYDAAGFEDLAWWNKNDHDRAVEVVQLVKEVQKDPFGGSGQPTRLVHDFEGCVSRQIQGDHRLIYQILDDKIRILSCRYHQEFA